MQLDRFKHEFKRLNGVYATDKVVLFRNPLELYSLTTGKIIASFNSLDEALHFELDGKTLEQRISAWTEITFPVEHGAAVVLVSVLAAAGRPLVAAAARTKPPQTCPRV